MEILVIGGTYFLGWNFVELAKIEHKLTLLNRGSRKREYAADENITTFTADRHDSEKLKELGGKKFDVVVDFCAYAEGDIRSMLETIDGKCGQYIFISTCDVYKRGTGEILTEDSEFETRDFGGEAGAYILGKAALERELKDCCEGRGINYTSIRPAFIYGPGNYAPRESMYFNWIIQAGKVIYPENSDGFFQMVHVKDLAKIILEACGRKEAYNEAFNVCGMEMLNYERFTEALQSATGIEFDRVSLTVDDIMGREIPLPFPLKKEESENYDSEKVKAFEVEYTALEDGLREAFLEYKREFLDIKSILARVDQYFDENNAKEAERLLTESLTQAKRCKDDGLSLQILNELIGYYRQTSEKEKLLSVTEEALALADKMGLKGSIPYATTALNAANASRSIGDLDNAGRLYKIAEEIYEASLAGDDMLFAGLYNNMSLLFQERKDYKNAEQYLLKALKIVEKNEAGFEIAVTYANLANTSVLAGGFESAEKYAQKSIECFKERNLYDAHYCAALSALGMCRFEKRDYEAAEKLFAEGMELVEKSVGRNSQYERLKENREECRRKQKLQKEAVQEGGTTGKISRDKNSKKVNGWSEGGRGHEKVETEDDRGNEPAVVNKDTRMMEGKGMIEENAKIRTDEKGERREGSVTDKHKREDKGIVICRKYYEKYGIPMIREHFPEYESRIAVGLVGEGSDCYGFDDEASRDHDWGPDFCMWLSDEVYVEIGEKLQKCYEELPDEFMGFRRTKSEQGDRRRGVFSVAGFYERLLGYGKYEDIDWRSVQDYQLSVVVNGEVFRDDEGIFSEFRDKLKKGYPKEIRCLKIAEDMAAFSQNSQYNYFRMLGRNDRFTADMLMYEGLKASMKLMHHMNNVYPPHDKWLKKSTAELPDGEILAEQVKKLDIMLKKVYDTNVSDKNVASYSTQEIRKLTDEVGDFFARRLYALNDISDVDPYLDFHTEEVLKRAHMETLSDEELVNRIVKLEFEAFDKVKNEGGRAYCQNDWPTFSIMRKSQYMTWNRDMLMQYLYDFNREYAKGHNLITEKYGRMMESTDPERYAEIKGNFPELTPQKKAIIEQIVGIQMQMMEEFAKDYPKLAGHARNLHTYEDEVWDTSYETYLRGEISTYSDKMLQLYGGYVVGCLSDNVNIARKTIENTVKLYGYKSMEELSEKIQ